MFGPPTFAAPLARLESPAPEAFLRSGIGLIRGWSCDAGRVEISIDGGPLLATAQGTDRPDTAQTCGRTDTGFGLIYNWNRVGDGVHKLRAFVGGVEFADVNFVIATLGGEFLTGLRGDYTVPDFPAPGDSAKIGWSEPHQNFVFVSPVTVPPVADPPNAPGAALESPVQGSSESGIGLIRGWVCTAGKVEISLDGGPLMATAHGTDRPDTAATCGRADTGFGLTYNWNRAGNGVHNLRAFADGVEFANVNFAVTTLGNEFITGLLEKIRLLGFPGTDPAAAPRARALATESATTTLEWSEPDQNFVITASTAAGERIAIVSLIADLRNKFALLGVGAQTDSASNTLGVQASKDAQGRPTAVEGLSWADTDNRSWADLNLGADGLPDAYRDSAGTRARLEKFTGDTVSVSFLGANDQVVAGPVTVPINGGLLQDLQQLVNRLRMVKASTVIAPQPASTAPQDLRLSLDSLLVNLLWSSGTATGEAMCAIQTAAANTGRNAIAPSACRSQLLASWLARATTPLGPQPAAATGSGIDPRAQQSLQFVADVADAPCEPADDSVGCLTPAATTIGDAIGGAPTLPPDNPPPPPPAQVTVPDLVGLTQSAATSAIAGAGLTLGSVTQQNSSTVPAGNVISQNPAAGASVAPGTAVSLVVSSGPTLISVPNLFHLYPIEATAILESASLRVGTVTQQFFTGGDHPDGSIFQQNPLAGTLVPLGTAVDFVIAVQGEGQITVPNVVGLDLSTATTTLQSSSLTVGTVTYQASIIPAGIVISQSPAAGTRVDPFPYSNRVVNLVVSSGPALPE